MRYVLFNNKYWGKKKFLKNIKMIEHMVYIQSYIEIDIFIMNCHDMLCNENDQENKLMPIKKKMYLVIKQGLKKKKKS